MAESAAHPLTSNLEFFSVSRHPLTSVKHSSYVDLSSLIADTTLALFDVERLLALPKPLAVIVPSAATLTLPQTFEDLTEPAVPSVAAACLRQTMALYNWSIHADCGVIPAQQSTLLSSAITEVNAVRASFTELFVLFHIQFHQAAGSESRGTTPLRI